MGSSPKLNKRQGGDPLNGANTNYMQDNKNKKQGRSNDPGTEMLIRILISTVLCLFTYIVTKPNPSSSSTLLEAVNTETKKSSSSELVTQVVTARGFHRSGHVGILFDRTTQDVSFWNGMETEFVPHIVWLMSYPNSGTSFTMTLVQRSTNLSTASNYADEVTPKDDNSLSIYPRHPEGPFWEGLSGKMGMIRRLPTNYILTKTHCGSRCIHCPPQQYVETAESFLDACRNTSARIHPNGKRHSYAYPASRVKKAIHLVRNPYHNFVARFHLDYKNFVQHSKKSGSKQIRDAADLWLKDHPFDEVGFQRWCRELDNKYKLEESKMFEYDLLQQIRLSPCHGEVYKYIQWHNLAFEMEENLGLDVLVVHYEDYEQKFNATKDRILNFMEQPAVAEPKPFSPGHEYHMYYTHLDKRRIGLLVKEIASERTWKEIEHYFDKNKTEFFDHSLEEEKDPKKGWNPDY